MADAYRIGEAAAILGVRVETLRRWEREAKLKTKRTSGGQRLVPAAEVARLLSERHGHQRVSAGSVRNRFPGVVIDIKKDKVAATVEILAGPHRIVSLMTAEAVEEMGLKVGDEAVGVVKATTVIVEIPSSKESKA